MTKEQAIKYLYKVYLNTKNDSFRGALAEALYYMGAFDKKPNED